MALTAPYMVRLTGAESHVPPWKGNIFEPKSYPIPRERELGPIDVVQDELLASVSESLAQLGRGLTSFVRCSACGEPFPTALRGYSMGYSCKRIESAETLVALHRFDVVSEVGGVILLPAEFVGHPDMMPLVPRNAVRARVDSYETVFRSEVEVELDQRHTSNMLRDLWDATLGAQPQPKAAPGKGAAADPVHEVFQGIWEAPSQPSTSKWPQIDPFCILSVYRDAKCTLQPVLLKPL